MDNNQQPPTLSPPPVPPVQQQLVTSKDPKQKMFQRKKIIYRINQVIWYTVAFILTLLTFRMLLLAIGADPTSGFSKFVNKISNPFSSPFNGILKPTVTNTSTFEWSILVAAAVYALIAFALVHIIKLILKPVSREEVEQAVGDV